MNPIAYVETGVIQCADNLESLSDLPPACIDLIYLDPPFFSNRNHQVVWGEEVRRVEDNIWHGSMNFYIDWMKKRAREMRRNSEAHRDALLPLRLARLTPLEGHA